MDPQAQAIRTKKWEIKFQGLETDRVQSRGAMGDFLLKFLVPGTNAAPINSEGQVSRNDWIKWAEPCWDDIIQTDTLNYKEGRAEEDTKHICPFALEVVRRLILLYSNPGEVVFDPFAGIGSTGFIALGGMSKKTKKRIFDQRRFYGCELKKEYHTTALKNCERALKDFGVRQNDLALSHD
jgi:DNA modification methylase